MPSPIAQPGHPRMGGIKKGQKIKRTLAREALERAAKERGVEITPMMVMQQIMTDSKSGRKLRLQAASNMAPYVHRKQPTTVELRDITELSNEELRRIADRSKAAVAANPDGDPDDDE